MNNVQVELFLYSKKDCSACDVFKTRLDENNIPYYLINISDDPELKYRYGARLPVLVAGNTELCAGSFNLQIINNYIQGGDN